MSKEVKKEIKLSVRQMEHQRDGEWDHLRAQVATLVDTVKNDPGEWIGDHPYAATGGAALAGFVVAQLPLPSLKRKEKSPRKHKEKDQDHHDDHAEGQGMLMGLLTSLAEQYLGGGGIGRAVAGGAPGPKANEEDGFVTVADGGTVSGATFPSDFSAHTAEPSAAAACA